MASFTDIAEKISILNEELKTLDGFLSLSIQPNMGTITVHMMKDVFTESADKFYMRDRGDDKYPTELFASVKGVTFIALSREPLPESEAV